MFIPIPDSLLRRLGVSRVERGDTVILTVSLFGRVLLRAELEMVA